MRYFISATAILIFILAGFSQFMTRAVSNQCAPLTPPTVSGSLVQPVPAPNTLFINEALLTPHRVAWNCSESASPISPKDAWIEIYNPQDQPLDLYAGHTSLDNGPNTPTFYFPFESAIAPHGFLVVFPYTLGTFNGTQADWRLLVSGTVVNEVTVPTLGEDQAYARTPDGSSMWTITNAPTINASDTVPIASFTPTITKAEATAIARTQNGGKGNKGTSTDRTGSGKSNTDSAGSNVAGTATPEEQQQIDGVQPTWTALQHPDTVPTTTSSIQVNNTVLVKGANGLDITHKILLTGLLIAFASLFFWCWRLFRAP